MAPQESVARGAGRWPPGSRARPPPRVGPRSSHKRPFPRERSPPRVHPVCRSRFPSHNTLLKPLLSEATLTPSFERPSRSLRGCTHAHVRRPCPRLDQGSGPRLTAGCPPRGGLHTHLIRSKNGSVKMLGQSLSDHSRQHVLKADQSATNTATGSPPQTPQTSSALRPDPITPTIESTRLPIPIDSPR